MAKTAQELLNQNNVNKGITTGLDSEATVKPQPSKNFNAWSNKTDGSNPESPSTNPATRREKYGINQGTTVPESTKIGAYDTVSSYTPRPYTSQQPQTEQDYLWAIKKLPWYSYATIDFDKRIKEVQDKLREEWIDVTKEVYWDMMTEAANQLVQLDIQEWQLKAQLGGLTNTMSSNAQLVYTLAKEVWSWLAQWQSISQISKQLWQEERVIQKIANNQTEELIQLNADYEEEQMREYLRYREDLDADIARNITQYNNIQKNLDYQFNSAMQTLRRSLFDAEWTAKGTAAWLGMTWTEYTLNRIQAQYDQQMWDIKNTYNYQSANAQIAINNALEDYNRNLQRRWEDYITARKWIQWYVLQELMNIQNNIWLTADQVVNSLSTLKANTQKAQSQAMQDYMAAIENGQTWLAKQIAQAYGLTDMTVKQFTSQELGRTSTSTIWNDTNNLWHILASDDWTRIWTYKSANGYTYNVYATREDWLLATQWLLQRAYYGKTLRQAAQKWIWQGKDISWAVAVLKELWLDPNAILSDENVRDFMLAIGRREGTIKQWQTLDERVKEGKTLKWREDEVEKTDEDKEAIETQISQNEEMYKLVSQYLNEIKDIDFDENIVDKLRALWLSWRLLDVLVDKWIKTNWQLLFALTNTQDMETRNTLTWLIAWNTQFAGVLEAASTLSMITERTFINQLIDAKSKWATFWNLTEWEGQRIVDAYNYLNGRVWKDNAITRWNELLKTLEESNARLGKEIKTTEQNVIPTTVTEEEWLNEIMNEYGSWVVITPL